MKSIECKRCVLNTDDDPTLTVNEQGICNYCQKYDMVASQYLDKEKNRLFIEQKLKVIRKQGKHKKFDCILGLSGGVDSSYLALWAKENGLRPLIVHFDNGWNSELAVHNIENICITLDLELHTIVMNWEEFKELQLAYFSAGVIDIECASDHAIIATLYNLAYQYKIHYILAGVNHQTEIVMPKKWTYNKQDYRNLKYIYKSFSENKRLRHYPTKPFYKQLFFRYLYKVEFVEFLNYIDYNKAKVKTEIKEKLGWRDYGGKHYESTFTKFYQSYILPVKFGIDKRRAHLSNLICSNQITRDEALAELTIPPYDKEKIEEDIEYVLKKWNLSRPEFDSIMNAPLRSHEDFPSDQDFYNIFRHIKRNLLWIFGKKKKKELVSIAQTPNLIKKAQKGDILSLNRLAELWYPMVYNFVLKYFANEDVATEVSNAIFETARHQLYSLKTVDEFRIWLYKIVIDHCLQIPPQFHQYNKYSLNLPSQVMKNSKINQIILNALQELPEEQRIVIILKKYEHFKIQDISKLLKISESAVKKNIYHGFQGLKSGLMIR